jgi:hypothetical protein
MEIYTQERGQRVQCVPVVGRRQKGGGGGPTGTGHGLSRPTSAGHASLAQGCIVIAPIGRLLTAAIVPARALERGRESWGGGERGKS